MIHLYDYVYFLVETKITQQQLLFLMFLYEPDDEALKMYKEAFPTDDGTLIGEMWIKDLIKQGYIKKNDDSYEVTDKFRKYFVSASESYKELTDAYPAFFTNDKNVKIPLVLADRYEYMSKYKIATKGSDSYHKKVLNLLDYGIKNNLIKMGINKFIDSRYWEQIEKLKKDNSIIEGNEDDNFDIDRDF